MNISMEVLKTLQGNLVGKDIEMSYIQRDNTRQYCKVLNTSIIEELGDVEFVLSDKTGTLTSNQMVFKNVWVEGTEYSAESMLEEKYRLLKDANFIRFWTAVVLCHQVVVDSKKQQYQGSSADEVCFLEYAKFLGFIFRKRTKVSVEIEVFNQKKVYELLLLLPFTDRKMMTVVVRDIEAQCVVVLTKGADSSVLAAISPQQSKQKIDSLQSSLSKFSKIGLRTLVFGLKVIRDQQFAAILHEYETFRQEKVSSKISKQAEKVKFREIVGKLENNLTLIGVSAIEDKLQQGVPQTIKRLQEADIKVVMITGDKLETAENIGTLSNFIQQNSKIYRITNDVQDCRAEIDKIGSEIESGGGTAAPEFCLLIEGNAIQKIIECQDKAFIKSFAGVVSRCKSLIFCRSTPAQKGLIVRFFKQNFKKTVLAIGDGGNDVSMIQEADIGVGLLGREGNQAASASDFNFCQFRFLDRLLLHHGRWAYYRIAYFFVYYGFKNMLITFIMFFYLAYCGWSGANVLSSAYLTVYNSLISVFLTIYYGVLQQDINSDMYSPAYIVMPRFYKEYKSIKLFSYFKYIMWSIASLVCSAFIFFTTIYGLTTFSPGGSHGHISDFRSVSWSLSISTFIAITIVIYLDMYNFTYVSWFVLGVLTILVAVIYFIIENFLQISPNFLAWNDNFNLKWWLVLLINAAAVWGFRVAYNTIKFSLYPTLIQKWMFRRNVDYTLHHKLEPVIDIGTIPPVTQQTNHRLQQPYQPLTNNIIVHHPQSHPTQTPFSNANMVQQNTVPYSSINPYAVASSTSPSSSPYSNGYNSRYDNHNTYQAVPNSSNFSVHGAYDPLPYHYSYETRYAPQPPYVAQYTY